MAPRRKNFGRAVEDQKDDFGGYDERMKRRWGRKRSVGNRNFKVNSGRKGGSSKSVKFAEANPEVIVIDVDEPYMQFLDNRPRELRHFSNLSDDHNDDGRYIDSDNAGPIGFDRNMKNDTSSDVPEGGEEDEYDGYAHSGDGIKTNIEGDTDNGSGGGSDNVDPSLGEFLANYHNCGDSYILYSRNQHFENNHFIYETGDKPSDKRARKGTEKVSNSSKRKRIRTKTDSWTEKMESERSLRDAAGEKRHSLMIIRQRKKIAAAPVSARTRARSKVLSLNERRNRAEDQYITLNSLNGGEKYGEHVINIDEQASRPKSPDSNNDDIVAAADVDPDYEMFFREGKFEAESSSKTVRENEQSSSDSEVIELKIDPNSDNFPFVISRAFEIVCDEDPVDTVDNSKFSKDLLEILKKPYDDDEYEELREEITRQRPIERERQLRGGVKRYPTDVMGKSYLDLHDDFKVKFCEAEAEANRPKVLNLLRGFFYWLQNVTWQGTFRPWLDPSIF